VDFIGTGQRLTSTGLMTAANKVGVDPATLRAVLEVETAGAGFDGKNRLKLLFEPHIFYKQLGPGPEKAKTCRNARSDTRLRPKAWPSGYSRAARGFRRGQ